MTELEDIDIDPHLVTIIIDVDDEQKMIVNHLKMVQIGNRLMIIDDIAIDDGTDEFKLFHDMVEQYDIRI